MTLKDNVRTDVPVTDWRSNLPRRIYSHLERLTSAQTWFEVYRVKRDVFALYEPGQFEEVISYLVLGNKGAALIDTGMGIGNVRKLVEELTSLPIRVVNTHSHYDHIGQDYLFGDVAIFDVPSARHASEEGYTKSQMGPLLAEELLSRSLPEDFDLESYHIPPFAVTRWLKDGDVINLGSRRLEVLHTPGHSPDSICLLDREAKLLWTGDMYYPGPIYVHLQGSDLDAFIDSYERMISLASCYNVLLPSHNEPLVEKGELERVLHAAREIKSGTARFVEAVDAGVRVRRYEYERFVIITKAS